MVKTLLEFMLLICTNIVFEVSTLIFIKIIGITYVDNFYFNFSYILIEFILVMILCYLITNKKIIHDFQVHHRILIYFIFHIGFFIMGYKAIWKYKRSLIINNLYIFVIGFTLLLNFFYKIGRAHV